MDGHVISVNVTAEIFVMADGTRSGIDKRGVERRVYVNVDGLLGDQVLDGIHHGGPDKAVYAYAEEDARWWAERTGRLVHPGEFGENLTTSLIDVSGALIGERWQIGSALLEIAQPRIPCRVFAAFWDRPGWVREFTEAARPGAYLRVIETGDLAAGDVVKIAHRPDHGVTVAQAFRARTGARELVPLLVEAGELPESWRLWAASVMESGNGEGS